MHELAFNWVVVTYFVLGGMSAGSFLLSVAANYWLTDYKPIAKKAAIASFVSLALGLIFLLADLGQPLRAWRLFFAGNPTSIISWGTWILLIMSVVCLVYIWFLHKGDDKKAKLSGYVGIPFAILTAVYTAFILSGSPAVELWNSSLLPILFFTGGLISGGALIMLISMMSESTKPLVPKLGKIVAVLVIVEFGLMMIELVQGGQPDLPTVYIVLLWVLELFIGSVVPVVILLFYNRLSTKLTSKPYFNAIAPILALVGIYTMRYIVVIGGQA
ncbi:MAG: polysulfide reductase NrfD [Anaerolineales bacterium]|nr:polysulfide reductase NrfD [Anaerolineales bacterium]